jgi:hypothetical protein
VLPCITNFGSGALAPARPGDAEGSALDAIDGTRQSLESRIRIPGLRFHLYPGRPGNLLLNRKRRDCDAPTKEHAVFQPVPRPPPIPLRICTIRSARLFGNIFPIDPMGLGKF